MYHKWANREQSSSGIYVSTRVQSAQELDKGSFQGGRAEWISVKPEMGDKWSACVQTLEGHSDSVNSVTFSHDSAQLGVQVMGQNGQDLGYK